MIQSLVNISKNGAKDGAAAAAMAAAAPVEVFHRYLALQELKKKKTWENEGDYLYGADYACAWIHHDIAGYKRLCDYLDNPVPRPANLERWAADAINAAFRWALENKGTFEYLLGEEAVLRYTQPYVIVESGAPISLTNTVTREGMMEEVVSGSHPERKYISRKVLLDFLNAYLHKEVPEFKEDGIITVKRLVGKKGYDESDLYSWIVSRPRPEFTEEKFRQILANYLYHHLLEASTDEDAEYAEYDAEYAMYVAEYPEHYESDDYGNDLRSGDLPRSKETRERIKRRRARIRKAQEAERVKREELRAAWNAVDPEIIKSQVLSKIPWGHNFVPEEIKARISYAIEEVLTQTETQSFSLVSELMARSTPRYVEEAAADKESLKNLEKRLTEML